VNSQTTTYTGQQTDTLVYKTKGRYGLNNFKKIRLLETEFGRYVASNKFMHGVEDENDIGMTNGNIA
jgi:hypothetical protein